MGSRPGDSGSAPSRASRRNTWTCGETAVYSGRRFNGTARPNDAAMHDLVLRGSTAFWDAYLKADPTAKRFLDDDDGYKKLVGNAGTVERRGADGT